MSGLSDAAWAAGFYALTVAYLTAAHLFVAWLESLTAKSRRRSRAVRAVLADLHLNDHAASSTHLNRTEKPQ
jgi:hypothetical protein